MQDRQQTVHRNTHRSARRKRGEAEIQDLLSSIPDRLDLERLFERKVVFSQILRLTGRDVSLAGINELLDSPDLHRDLKKLLDS